MGLSATDIRAPTPKQPEDTQLLLETIGRCKVIEYDDNSVFFHDPKMGEHLLFASFIAQYHRKYPFGTKTITRKIVVLETGDIEHCQKHAAFSQIGFTKYIIAKEIHTPNFVTIAEHENGTMYEIDLPVRTSLGDEIEILPTD